MRWRSLPSCWSPAFAGFPKRADGQRVVILREDCVARHEHSRPRAHDGFCICRVDPPVNPELHGAA